MSNVVKDLVWIELDTHTFTNRVTYRALKSRVPRGVTVKNENRRMTNLMIFGHWLVPSRKRFWTIIWVPGKLAKV